MNAEPGRSYARNLPDPDAPSLGTPSPVVVVGCEIDISYGCFSADESPTHHHQRSRAHRDAMAGWAIDRGMYRRDALDLAQREPLRLDEAIGEILAMDPERRDSLHNVGGWIVWYVGKRAVGGRRPVAPIAARPPRRESFLGR